MQIGRRSYFALHLLMENRTTFNSNFLKFQVYPNTDSDFGYTASQANAINTRPTRGILRGQCLSQNFMSKFNNLLLRLKCFVALILEEE